MKKKKVNLIIFTDNQTKKIVRDMAFMKCPYCKREILLNTDRVTFCHWRCRQEHKVAYRLNLDNKSPEGFNKVLYSKVKDFRKKTLMEEFENGS